MGATTLASYGTISNAGEFFAKSIPGAVGQRISIRGTFDGTLSLEYKYNDQPDADFRVQKIYTGPTMPDDLISCASQVILRLIATTWNSGTAEIEFN